MKYLSAICLVYVMMPSTGSANCNVFREGMGYEMGAVTLNENGVPQYKDNDPRIIKSSRTTDKVHVEFRGDYEGSVDGRLAVQQAPASVDVDLSNGRAVKIAYKTPTGVEVEADVAAKSGCEISSIRARGGKEKNWMVVYDQEYCDNFMKLFNAAGMSKQEIDKCVSTYRTWIAAYRARAEQYREKKMEFGGFAIRPSGLNFSYLPGVNSPVTKGTMDHLSILEGKKCLEAATEYKSVSSPVPGQGKPESTMPKTER